MFYTYNQNNSGGVFIVGDGVTHNVIIEASSASEADAKAEEIGIYFDDDYTVDCPCCGPRWSRAYDSEGNEQPTIYGEPVVDYEERWGERGEPYAYVYYLNGTVAAYPETGSKHR